MKRAVNVNLNLANMKGRSQFFVALVLIAIAATCTFYYIRHNSNPKYVFINETADHRFDESIRISILAAFKRTGVQNAVVITDVESPNENFEQSAVNLFKKLDLGRMNHGRAILYYFNPMNKNLKIEVGYALEGDLPDSTVHGLELAAKSFIFSDRYQDFWAELINTINIEIQSKGNTADSNFDFNRFKFLSGGAGKISKSYDASWKQLQEEFKSPNSVEAEKYVAQLNPEASLKVYLESLHNGYGDSNLDILTSESKFFRNQTPLTSYQLFRNWNMYEKAGVDKIIIADQIAFAFFKDGHPVLPVVLRKEGNVWRTHEPLSWSLFQRFEDSNQVFLKYNLADLPKPLNLYINERFKHSLFSLEMPLSVGFLSQQPNLQSFSSPLVHLYWLANIESKLVGKDLESMTSDELIFAADAYTNLGEFSKFIHVYKLIAKRFPQDRSIQQNLKFYEEIIDFDKRDWRLSR